MPCLKTFSLFTALCLLASGGYTQERTANGPLQTEASWAALKNLTEQANNNAKAAHIRLNQMEKCMKEGKLYAPGTEGTDVAGCSPMMSKLQVFQKMGAVINGLTPDQTYLVSVYGFATGTGHIVVRECATGTILGQILAQSARIGITGRTTTDSTLLSVKAPASGCIQGYTHSTRNAYSLTAFTIQ